MKSRSCLTQFISFFGEVTLVGEGKAVDVAYMSFSKAFDRVCHNILLEKLASLWQLISKDGRVLCRIKTG